MKQHVHLSVFLEGPSVVIWVEVVAWTESLNPQQYQNYHDNLNQWIKQLVVHDAFETTGTN
jgi:hypothetical protein